MPMTQFIFVYKEDPLMYVLLFHDTYFVKHKSVQLFVLSQISNVLAKLTETDGFCFELNTYLLFI